MNAKSEEPLQVKFKISIKDGNGSIIAYYDWETATRKFNYTAQAIEIEQFKIESDNQVTGEEGVYTLTFDVGKG